MRCVSQSKAVSSRYHNACLSSSVAASEVEEAYDVMISYRQSSEKSLAQLLYHNLSHKTAGSEGRQLRVFLDRERLLAGKR